MGRWTYRGGGVGGALGLGGGHEGEVLDHLHRGLGTGTRGIVDITRHVTITITIPPRPLTHLLGVLGLAGARLPGAEDGLVLPVWEECRCRYGARRRWRCGALQVHVRCTVEVWCRCVAAVWCRCGTSVVGCSVEVRVWKCGGAGAMYCTAEVQVHRGGAGAGRCTVAVQVWSAAGREVM